MGRAFLLERIFASYASPEVLARRIYVVVKIYIDKEKIIYCNNCNSTEILKNKIELMQRCPYVCPCRPDLAPAPPVPPGSALNRLLRS